MDGNWEDLVGRLDHVYSQNRIIRTGYVDAVTRSEDTLWIGPEGADGRMMCDKAEGHRVVSV
jgi:hypothetical protein